MKLLLLSLTLMSFMIAGSYASNGSMMLDESIDVHGNTSKIKGTMMANFTDTVRKKYFVIKLVDPAPGQATVSLEDIAFDDNSFPMGKADRDTKVQIFYIEEGGGPKVVIPVGKAYSVLKEQVITIDNFKPSEHLPAGTTHIPQIHGEVDANYHLELDIKEDIDTSGVNEFKEITIDLDVMSR